MNASLRTTARRLLQPVFAIKLKRLYAQRAEIARPFLRGSGVEIGALNAPLRLPSNASVRYVDRMPFDEIAAYCPQFKPENLAPVEIVDDGETLATLPDASLDFVIANHMVEHSEDPIGTLKNHLRVLRPGGILFWALPDMRHTFDLHRSLTTVAHLMRDYEQGPEGSRLEHCTEWARLVEHVPESQVAEKGRALCEARVNIHFHVWTRETFAELLEHCRAVLHLPFTVESLTANDGEFIAVLRRTG